jgi:hypothetical protein
MSTLILAADTGSKTAYYVAAGLFAVWAVTLGVIGITRPSFPNGPAGGRIVMTISVLLMAATMASAVIVSS